MRILLATPCGGGQVHHLYTQSLLTEAFLNSDRLQNQHRYELGSYLVGGFSGLAKDRGVVASYALREGFDKIVFIDSDQSWAWPQLKALLDSDKMVIAGVVALKEYPIQLNFTPLVEDKDCFEGGKITPNGLKKLQKKHAGTYEIEVQACGTAFLAIDTSVLKALVENKSCPMFLYKDVHSEKMVENWDFFQTGVINERYYGEDYSFCFQAKRAGFSAYINSFVHIDHHGGHTYSIGKEIQNGI